MGHSCKRCERLGRSVAELALRWRSPSKHVWNYVAHTFDLLDDGLTYIKAMAGLWVLTEPYVNVVRAVSNGSTHVIVWRSPVKPVATLCGYEVRGAPGRIVFRRELARHVTCKRCLIAAKKATPPKLEDLPWSSEKVRKIVLGGTHD